MYENFGNISILDKDGGRPTVIKGTEIPGYAIIAMSLIFILLFWFWVFTKLRREAPKPTYFLQCPEGTCATNIHNGEKRCLDDPTTSIIYDPTFEVCNSRSACENRRTMFAVQEDGSTNGTGVCPSGVTCRCLEKPRCATSVVATFSSVNGILTGGAEANEANDAIILQGPQLVQGDASISLDFDDPVTQFCAIRPIFLNRLVPRTKECNYGEDPTYEEVLACIKSNPCTIGRVAFKPLSREGFQFRLPSVNGAPSKPNMSVPISCVADREDQGVCVADQVPVWDYAQGNIACMS